MDSVFIKRKTKDTLTKRVRDLEQSLEEKDDQLLTTQEALATLYEQIATAGGGTQS